MLKTAGSLAIAVALFLPLSACGSTTATSAASSASASPAVEGSAATAVPEPSTVASESSSSPSAGSPKPSLGETDVPLLMAKNSSVWDRSPEQIEEFRVAFCVGIDGDPPLLKKGFVRLYSQSKNTFSVFIVDSTDKSNSSGVVLRFDGRGSADMADVFGVLTEADVAPGKAVYYLEPEFWDVDEIRSGGSQVFSTVKVPGGKSGKTLLMVPESACAGLRD
jgi:hypothetical protein